MISRKKSDPLSDKDLVAEQPGLGMSFIGIFIAFFVGIAIRAAISPDRVQEHLEKATQKIHRDIHVSFGHAYVSLSDGVWPDLSVVIEEVRLEATKSCWMKPLAEINEIRLPLSMRHLLRGQILIHEVLAGEVNLSLRESYADCESDRLPSSDDGAPVAASTTTVPSNVVSPGFENVKRSNPIDSISIKHLNIHYLPIAFTSFYIENFLVQLKAENPRWIQLAGKVILNRDVDSYDTGAHANLQVDSYEGPNPSLDLGLKGLWREGHFDLSGHFEPGTQDLKLQADIRHLPLSQIIPYLKKYRLMESEFNGKRAWISGQLKFVGNVQKLQQTPARFDNLRLEGDLGEVSCTSAEITSLNPLVFKPIDLDIRGLNVRELLVFLNRPHPTPALGELGTFNGTAHFINPEQLSLRGDYSGLEFIFSNRGSRQTQALSLISGELELKKNRWQIQVDRVKPVEGIFEGKLQMSADKDFKDLSIDAKISELGLAPKIQSLMTGGGSLGALSGQLKIHLKEAQISDLGGQLKWDQLLIEGVKLSKPKLNLKMVSHELRMDLNASELEITPKETNAVFSSLFQNLGADTLQMQSPQTQIRTRQFKTLKWDRFQAQSSFGGIRSSGGWDENSVLSGQLQINGKKTKTWKIQGTRNQPIFISQEL
jgi:hypothetical protein